MNDLVVVERLAKWDRLRGVVLDSVSSPIAKRVYNMALNEVMAWSQQAPPPGGIENHTRTAGSAI
jgi:hypothetical protein